jgi:hypothetical protein
MSKDYKAPTVTTLGTVQQLTEQKFNKVGDTSDSFSPTTPLVGSLVPAP